MITTQPRYTQLRDFYPIDKDIEGEVQNLRTHLERLEERRGKTGDERPAAVHLEDRHSAKQVITRSQMLFVCGTLLFALVGGLTLPISIVADTLGTITTFYLGQLLLSSFFAIRELARSEDTQGSDPRITRALWRSPWPDYTILCPLYQEAQVIPQFLAAIEKIDYPHDRLQVLLLTEEDDIATRDAIRAHAPLPSYIELVVVPQGMPRTKPRACNYGLSKATGRYVVVYDAEDVPEPDQLKKAVLAFAKEGPKTACLQARLGFYNATQNILTRLFAIEYLTWFTLVLPAFARSHFALPLGGTSNHFQTSVLRALGGWDAYNVTEDCDLGMRLHQYGFVTGMLDSTTHEEATSSIPNWIRQRSRWIKGFLQTYLVHTRHPLNMVVKKKRLGSFLSLQALVGGSFVVFVNPIMWALLAVYILFRPQVEDTYHLLFPTPVLYGGCLCLIGGNFTYIYMSMLICTKRGQDNLVPWCLLLPCSWLLMSVAGMRALYQLITKPHYWEKTRHGFHLGRRSMQRHVSKDVIGDSVAIADKTTELIPIAENGAITISVRMRAIATLPIAIAKSQVKTTREKRDPWLWITIGLACVVSIAATYYSFTHHATLLYADAYAHLRIARGLLDNTTPGFAQLGGVWLPLPHLLMLPFVWNNYLWHTGLAGSFVSMICYIVATSYLFLSARKLTDNSVASFIGSLVFILNPNTLYLQSTPLSELVCIATFMGTIYYFLKWTQTKKPINLALVAGSAFLVTLSRYDGWGIFASLLLLIIVMSILERCPWKRIMSSILVFGTLGSLGIMLWFLWNQIIFGNFLFFRSGPFSAKTQQLFFLQEHTLYTYHSLWEAVRFYALDTIEVSGLFPFVLAGIALLVLMLKRNTLSTKVSVFAILTPFAFNILSLYQGDSIIFSPWTVPVNAPHQLFNVRFGIEMVAPLAILVSTLISTSISRLNWRLLQIPCLCLFLLAISIQSVYITQTGIITLQDGLYGFSCQPPHPITTYLAQHYNGGRVLSDVSSSLTNESQTGIDFKNIVYDGSGSLWKEATHDPGLVVTWVIVDPHSINDLVIRHLNIQSSQFLSEFRLIMQEKNSGLQLYLRNGIPVPPVKTFPPNLPPDNERCNPENR